MNQLIRCIDCDVVFMKTPFDQWPDYAVPPPPTPESLHRIERNDFEDFLKNHHGHQLENLKILEDSYISEKAYLEPVKTSYFKATNGKENFVVKKFRKRIDEPLNYQLFEGDYLLTCTGIQIQSEAIQKQIEREFKDPPFSPQQVASFIKLYQHISEMMTIENLERCPQESPYPLEIYYKMDDISLMYLLRNCHNIFKGQEYRDIENFIHRHKDDGVLVLKATYEIQIQGKAQMRKKVTPSLPLEVEKTVEEKKL